MIWTFCVNGYDTLTKPEKEGPSHKGWSLNLPLQTAGRTVPQGVQKRAEMELSTLETLTIRETESFLSFLEYQLGNNKLTINRKLSSLKSLFDYLQNKAETIDLKPYIQRNVMAKMDLNAVKESQETIANRIEGKIIFNTNYNDLYALNR